MKLMRYSGYVLVNDDFDPTKDTNNNVHASFQNHYNVSRSLLVKEVDELLENPNIDLAKLESYFKDDDSTSIANEDRLIIGATYKHFKGKIVRLLNVAKFSEDPTKKFAVYDCGENGIYARPLEMFLSEVDHEKYPEVQQKYRFELLM